MSRPATPARTLSLLTPEHVPLDFAVADVGSRLAALVVDLAIQLALLIAVVFVLSWTVLASEVGVAVLLIFIFALRNFYFTWFEIRWQGRTPGKRALGLRVVARDGGPLDAELLFARNLTRELEIFLPLSALSVPESLAPGLSVWARLATVVWVLAMALLPLFNRQRARLGDLLAGTVVVYEPKAKLDQDVAEEGGALGATEEHTFTPEQLDVYGIRELQVLEDLLRRPPSPDREEAMILVTEKIQRKIGWQSPAGGVQPRRFLQAFYAAQRARLEKKMLFGDRREHKVR